MHTVITVEKANVNQQLNRHFFWSVLATSLVVGMTEFVVMWSIHFLKSTGTTYSPTKEIFLDTLLVSLISSALLWFFVIRQLVISFTNEQHKVLVQDRLNKELRTALDAHALVSITDKKGVIVYANDKFIKVSGYSRDELIGQNHRIVKSDLHDRAFFRHMWKTIANGGTWHGTICNRNKNGELYWVDSTIMPLLDKDGKPRQYISVRREITQQVINESRLKTLKRAVDACNEMILITDAKGVIQYANPALYRFTGWSEAALLGQHAAIFNSSKNLQHALESWELSILDGSNWSGRLLCLKKGSEPFAIHGQSRPPDPREFWSEISIAPVLNDDDSLYGFVQIMRDISALVSKENHQQIEKESTTSRLEIANILQMNAPLHSRFKMALGTIFMLNGLELQRKGGIFLKSQTELSLELFTLFGVFSQDFIEKEQRVLFGDCLCGRAAAANELIISDDCFCDPRHDHQFKDMQTHGHYIVPLSSGDEVLGIMFLYTDPYPNRDEARLTMLKQVGDLMALAILREQTQRTLEKARDMAMQASEFKSQFLANMSHEVRTPVNGVLGMLDLLSDTELSRTQSDLVETAKHSAESLLEILNDVLDFSKLEAGKIEIEQVSFNLRAVVEEVASLLAHRAYLKGLELNCFLPVDLPTYWLGDPMRIRQILTNLIGNAIKFTEKGEISIKLNPIDSDGAKHVFRFEVIDTGIGISPSIQSRLFSPFIQAETSTARRFGGTGLGLSICKNLLALMGGDIGLESEPGKGSCFWFTLPLTADENCQDKAAIDFSGKSVLVVDDNATNRVILNHYLSHWGLNVVQADSGQSAIQALAACYDCGRHVDLVILDMHMPIMDGLDLAGKMNENAEFKTIPRILLSSGTLIKEEQQYRYGIAHSLLKPVRQSQLFDTIADVLCHHKIESNENKAAAPRLPDYHDKSLLVVEDNKVNQKVIKGLLAKFNITPTVADNGKLALDLWEEGTFDLILMDCQMPVLDGYETTAAIRKREQMHHVSKRQVIVALTAHAVSGEKEKCLAAGMDDYLSKPIRQDRLGEILTTWLTRDTAEKTNARVAADDLADNLATPHASNWDEKETLRHLDNDKELLFDMIAMFLEEMPSLLTKLTESLEHNDLSGIANATHAIKGSVGYFCAQMLNEDAAYLERAARQQEAVDYHKLIDKLVSAVKTLMTELEQYAQTNQSG